MGRRDSTRGGDENETVTFGETHYVGGARTTNVNRHAHSTSLHINSHLIRGHLSRDQLL